MKRFNTSKGALLLAVVLISWVAANQAGAQIIELPCDVNIASIYDQTIYSGEEFYPFNVFVLWGGTGCTGSVPVLSVETPVDLVLTMVGVNPYQVTISYPEGWIGSETITFTAELGSEVAEETATFTVLPLPTGSICGTVTDIAANPLSGVTVTVFDNLNNPAGEPVVTGFDGGYLFEGLDIATYSVGVITPLGFDVSPSETQTNIEPGNPCTEVNFILTAAVTANDSRTMGFWKHQFDSYLNGHGTASVAETDLTEYLSTVYQHFDILGIYTELGTFDFEDAKNALAVRGDEPLVEAVKQQLFAMLLNFAAGNIGNYSVVTEDGRRACEVVSYAAAAIKDGDESSHQTAADICAIVNRGGLAPEGIVTASSMVYKMSDASMPNQYRLEQNYPNPFNPTTEMQFFLPQASHARLEVYNLLGQRVSVLADRTFESGWHSVTWNARGIASGIYLYRLVTENSEQTRKMMLLK